jgi:hypothetical protein
MRRNSYSSLYPRAQSPLARINHGLHAPEQATSDDASHARRRSGNRSPEEGARCGAPAIVSGLSEVRALRLLGPGGLRLRREVVQVVVAKAASIHSRTGRAVERALTPVAEEQDEAEAEGCGDGEGDSDDGRPVGRSAVIARWHPPARTSRVPASYRDVLIRSWR